MRRRVMAGLIVGLLLGASGAQAKDRAIEELPRDLWNLAFAWTEPIKSVAKQTRQFDPVSGLWFGMVDGSVKSVERTAEFFLGKHGDTDAEGPDIKGSKALLRYTF